MIESENSLADQFSMLQNIFGGNLDFPKIKKRKIDYVASKF